MFLTRLTSSPHFYTILYLAICLLAAFNIFEILFLLAHKRRLDRAEAKKELLKHKIASAIITPGGPGEAFPKPRSPLYYEAYSEAVSSILESFEGEITERAAQVIYKFKVDRYYKRLARRSVWYKRAHAIDVLSSLKLKKNQEFFYSAFRSETSNAVKYRILYGLSLLVRCREDLYLIARMLSGLPYLTSKYTEDIFFNIITALKTTAQEEEFGFFLKGILTDAKVTPGVKRDCLTACHAASCERAGGIVREYYAAFQNEPEIIIACIRTLVGMGDFSVVSEALKHKDWRVRLTAIKFAHLCGSDIVPDKETLLRDPEYHFAVLPGILNHADWQARLENLQNAHLYNTEILRELNKLLHDRNYHIRLNAALALSRIGKPGLEILRSETSSADRFASDAAKYALGLAEASA